MRRDVEGLLHRLRADGAPDHVPDGPALRDALQAILDKYTLNRGNAVVLLRGQQFMRGLTFDLMVSLGEALSGGRYFDVDISQLMTAKGAHGIFTEQVRSLWEAKLNQHPDYWKAVALVAQCPADASPGTNIVEAYHSVLRRDSTLQGRKGYNLCMVALDLAAKKYNYAILHATYKNARWVQPSSPTSSGGSDDDPQFHSRERIRRVRDASSVSFGPAFSEFPLASFLLFMLC